ncbi:hypothetical protein AB0M34_17950 [Nocardia sp. NPDC050193]
MLSTDGDAGRLPAPGAAARGRDRGAAGSAEFPRPDPELVIMG